jgi:uncharacterized protein YecT (DUF1311 family)
VRKFKAGIGLALAMLTPWAHAAGFDCAKAATGVEKGICATPKVSAADGQLGEAFKAALAAHPELADALKLDQRHWLASRDETLSAYPSVAKAQASVVGLYNDRIAFLKGLDTKPWPAPFDALPAALPKLPATGAIIPDDLAKVGAGITLAQDVQLEGGKGFPYEPDAKVASGLADIGNFGGYRKLQGSPVSSVWGVQGTAYCWEETPFRIEGKRAIAVPRPDAWGDGDCMTKHGIARIGDNVVAFLVRGASPDESGVVAATWNGKGFDHARMLVLRFDHALKLDGSTCSADKAPCDDFAKVAMAAATRFDRSPQKGAMDAAFPGYDKAAYAAVLTAAQANGGPLEKNGQPPVLPLLDGVGGNMTDYSSDAQAFPLVFRGETLLGLIDHGHVGWRVNNDWMVAAWRVKDGKAVPAAAAYVSVNRGKLLLAAPVPAPAPESH